MRGHTMIFGWKSKEEKPEPIPAGDIKVTQLTCSNCGAAHLSAESPNKYVCEYCGAIYLIEIDHNTGRLSDAVIKGSMQDADQIFAVHEKTHRQRFHE